MNESILLPKYTLYEMYVIATILTSYFMRLASNEVAHGRCLKDRRFTVVFHKSIRGVRLRKQSGSKNWFVKRIAKSSIKFTYYNFK